MLLAALDEDAFVLVTGEVHRVQHPPVGVAALRAEVYQTADRVRHALDDHSHLCIT